MLRPFVNCAMVLKKTLNFFFFQWPMNILRSYLNWWHNWQLNNRRRSHNFKGSLSMGDGRIFLITRCDVSFNKVLWNEPTFGRIHLAGQYLFKRTRNQPLKQTQQQNCRDFYSFQALLNCLLYNKMSTTSVSELGYFFLTLSSLHIIALDLDVRDHCCGGWC